jgi:protoporphyrinogen oxidase
LTEDGETFEADTVVIATPAPEAYRLTGVPMPTGKMGTVTLYFTGDEPLTRARKILLHANRGTFLNNVAPITNIAPEQAPNGKHLIAASVLGNPDGDDLTLFYRAQNDLKRMFTGDKQAQDILRRYEPLALYRIPYAQFAQPPGIHSTLPGTTCSIPGVLFAGEFTGGSSIHAAMESGERAAAHILTS